MRGPVRKGRGEWEARDKGINRKDSGENRFGNRRDSQLTWEKTTFRGRGVAERGNRHCKQTIVGEVWKKTISAKKKKAKKERFKV